MPAPTSNPGTATLEPGAASASREPAGRAGIFSDAAGEPFSLMGHTADQRIAELEAEVRSLRAEAEGARRLLDSATDHAIVTMNLGGRVTRWNTGARVILGYADAEILGRSGDVFFPAEDRARGVFLDELCRALDDGHAQNERWHLRRDGSRFWASGTMMPLLDREGNAEGFLNVFRDNTATRAEDERRKLLLAEMGYRVKNTLATVQAVAGQTLRRAGVPREVQETFGARLVALARSHDLLIRSDWEGAPLAEVVERALLPYGSSDRVKPSGPPVHLPASVVEMLGLAFHELATNAAKYGALSVPDGEIEVRWSLLPAKCGPEHVEIVWVERGGPPVTVPANRGFGSRLLEQGLSQNSGGAAKLVFRPEGLECRICLPVIPEFLRKKTVGAKSFDGSAHVT